MVSYAEDNEELIISKTETEDFSFVEISNIDKYIKIKRKLRRANSDYNADIYKTAGISDNSVLDLDYDLSTVRKMVLYEIKRTKVIAGTSQDDSS